MRTANSSQNTNSIKEYTHTLLIHRTLPPMITGKKPRKCLPNLLCKNCWIKWKKSFSYVLNQPKPSRNYIDFLRSTSHAYKNSHSLHAWKIKLVLNFLSFINNRNSPFSFLGLLYMLPVVPYLVKKIRE